MCDVPAPGTAYGLNYLAPKKKVGSGVLTEGQDRVELQREVTDVDGERRRVALCTGPDVVELLGLFKHHGSMRGSAVKVVQGSVKHRSRQRQEISRIRLTSGGGVREKFPAIGRVAVEEKGSRVILDSWSESI